MKRPLLLIFSGYNPRAVIAFLRTLTLHHIDYAIIAKSQEDAIFLSAYAPQVLAVRKKKELDIEDIKNCLDLIKEKQPASSYVVAPSTEALNRFFLENRHYFESLSVEIPLVDERLYATVSDKKSFSELCRLNGLAIPTEYQSLEQAALPFVAKPMEYTGCDKKIFSPVLIYSDADKKEFEKNYPIQDFYFQTLVKGQSYYLLYYFAQGGDVYKFSQKNIAQQPQGKSMVAALPATLHHDEISKKYEALLKKIGFHGLIMVEIIEKEEGGYVMIEANPRFWGPSQLFVDNGMNFFEPFLYDLGLLPMKPSLSPASFPHPYFWYGGIALTRKEGKEIVMHCPNDIETHPEKWLPYDIYRREDTLAIFHEETK